MRCEPESHVAETLKFSRTWPKNELISDWQIADSVYTCTFGWCTFADLVGLLVNWKYKHDKLRAEINKYEALIIMQTNTARWAALYRGII